MYQQITLIGNLGKDPEMRYTSSGQPVTTFTMAVSRTWQNQEGQRQEKTTWFRVTAWRRLAETCNQFLTKGRLVFVEGELVEPKPYQARDGQWRASLDVTAREVKFLSGRGEGGAPEGTAAPEGGDKIDEEEIPF